MAIERIEERRVGTRTVAGADFPVIDLVERHEFGGRVEWVLVRGLCNGTPDSAATLATRREALEQLHAE